VLQALPLFGDEFLERQQVQWGPVVDGLEIPDQPRELYERGALSRVPIVVGVTGDEGWNWVDRSFPTGIDAAQYERAVFGEFSSEAPAALRLYPSGAFATPKDALAKMTGDVEYVCDARRVARFVHRAGLPVYLYSYEYKIDDVSPGRAPHGTESNLLFGNDFAAPTAHVLTPADLSLFSTMSGYWRRFAESGDPNEPGNRVEWPAFRHDPVRGSESDRYLVFDSTVAGASFVRDEQCNFWDHYVLRSVTGTVAATTP
jgi:para-nitrobenzyl esterase